MLLKRLPAALQLSPFAIADTALERLSQVALSWGSGAQKTSKDQQSPLHTYTVSGPRSTSGYMILFRNRDVVSETENQRL